MSSLLKDAIVDAKALRESALKNAETSVINKYSEEVKATLDKLLEQDELGDTEAQTSEEIAEDVPLAATDDLSEQEGNIPNDIPETGQEVPVNIDLDALQEAVAALEAELSEQEGELDEDVSEEINEDEEIELSEDEEIELNEEQFAEILSLLEGEPELNEEGVEVGASAGEQSAAETEAEADEDKDLKMEEELDEEIDEQSLVDAIMEKLTVDMGAELAGWAGRSSDSMKLEMEKEMAHRRSTDVEEDMEELKKAQEDVVFENKQLKSELSQYKGALEELQENLSDVNLSNARLLYTNRVLRNTSLNERQKEKIVEAISNAGSVTEARTIFDTLQSTVEAKPKRSPQSLSEAIKNKRSSVIRATRQESAPSDPLQERMKRLAGIK